MIAFNLRAGGKRERLREEDGPVSSSAFGVSFFIIRSRVVDFPETRGILSTLCFTLRWTAAGR